MNGAPAPLPVPEKSRGRHTVPIAVGVTCLLLACACTIAAAATVLLRKPAALVTTAMTGGVKAADRAVKDYPDYDLVRQAALPDPEYGVADALFVLRSRSEPHFVMLAVYSIGNLPDAQGGGTETGAVTVSSSDTFFNYLEADHRSVDAFVRQWAKDHPDSPVEEMLEEDPREDGREAWTVWYYRSVEEAVDPEAVSPEVQYLFDPKTGTWSADD
jgi:hypothetical protein